MQTAKYIIKRETEWEGAIHIEFNLNIPKIKYFQWNIQKKKKGRKKER